jgi:hypothetical protein
MVKTTTETRRTVTWPVKIWAIPLVSWNLMKEEAKLIPCSSSCVQWKFKIWQVMWPCCASLVILTIPFIYLSIYIYIDLIMRNFLWHKFWMELHVVQLLMCGQICAGSNRYGFRGCEQQGVLWLRVWQGHHTRRCDHPEEGTSIWCMLSCLHVWIL